MVWGTLTIVGLIGCAIFFPGIRIVRPIKKGLIERFGKYKKTANAGFHWIIPVIDKMHKINITEIMVDVEPQEIITKEGLNATVDAVVYFKVEDVCKAAYNVDDIRSQIVSLARTTLRDIIGGMTLFDMNSKRNFINNKLEEQLSKKTKSWGICIINVELQNIDPPKDVQDSMNNIIKAEKEKEAAKDLAKAEETRADGHKLASIKKAQGDKESKILVSQGNKEARVLEAKGVAEAIKLENEAAEKFFIGNAQILKKLQVTQESLKENAKIVIPTDSELVNIIGELSGVVPIKGKKKKKDGIQ